MKSNSSHTLHQLVALARRAPQAPLPEELPTGFAGKVLTSLIIEAKESPWEFLSLRALPIAAALAALCVWLAPPSDTDGDEDDLAETFVSTTVTEGL